MWQPGESRGSVIGRHRGTSGQGRNQGGRRCDRRHRGHAALLTDFAAARELPVVGKIALGSLKNKLLFLLPAALALSLLAPHAIIPLPTPGGLYLCYEGTEKVY